METHTNWQVLKRLIAAPFMGLAFCIFLPFIGFAMVFWYGGKLICEKAKKVLDTRQERA